MSRSLFCAHKRQSVCVLFKGRGLMTTLKGGGIGNLYQREVTPQIVMLLQGNISCSYHLSDFEMY